MPDNDFWIGQEQIPVDLSLLLTYSNDEDYWYAPGEYALRVYTVDTLNTNMVLSVYSRQNFIRYFALLRDMDAFVFVSGRKIEALEDLSGLPLAGNCSGLDIDRILQRPKCLG